MDRMEVITGPERRRAWNEAEKATLMAELDAPGGSVAKFARRRGVSESLLYKWRAARRIEAANGDARSAATAVMRLRSGGMAGRHWADGAGIARVGNDPGASDPA